MLDNFGKYNFQNRGDVKNLEATKYGKGLKLSPQRLLKSAPS